MHICIYKYIFLFPNKRSCRGSGGVGTSGVLYILVGCRSVRYGPIVVPWVLDVNTRWQLCKPPVVGALATAECSYAGRRVCDMRVSASRLYISNNELIKLQASAARIQTIEFE